MGNQCCAAGGPGGEALEHYFGIPVSTLCTYEAQLLGMAAPSAANAFHVAMVDASGSVDGGGGAAGTVGRSEGKKDRAHSGAANTAAASTHIAFRERNERHHDVPVLVEAACRMMATMCPTTTTGAYKAPNVARLASSQTQPWVDSVRAAIDRTFVSNTEQWVVWHKASRKASKRLSKTSSQRSHAAAGTDDPLTTVMKSNECNTVRCLALLSYFFRHLPAPLMPPVMLTELEHELHPALPIEERRTCFLRVWHSVFAASHPVEYAVVERIAEAFYQLATRGHPSLTTMAAQPQRTTACVNDEWRDVLDAFLRQSWWIRSFTGRASAAQPTHVAQGASAAADSAQELLYDTIADAVFMIQRHPAREGDGERRPRPRSTTPPNAASPSRAKLQPQLGMVDGGEAPRGDLGATSTVGGAVRSAPPAPEPYDDGTEARGAVGVATAPVQSEAHQRVSTEGRHGPHRGVAASSAPTTSAAAAAHSSMVPSNSFSSASSGDDDAAPHVSNQNHADTVPAHGGARAAGGSDGDDPALAVRQKQCIDVPELDGGAAPLGPRSRQSSVAVSAVTLTPWQHAVDPIDTQHKHLPPLDIHDDGRRSTSGAEAASDASRRLMLAKAMFRGVGEADAEDRFGAQAHSESEHQGATNRALSRQRDTHADPIGLRLHDADMATVGPAVQAFMLESAEVFSAMRLEMEELRRQQSRTSAMCEEGLAHRSFREQTQSTMSEMASSVADVGEELLRMKQKVRDLEEALRLSNQDRDGLAAEAAAARFSASEVIMKFADMERSLLHHEQAIKYAERRLVDVDDDHTKVGSTVKMLRVDLDALQRRFLLFRDHI